MFAWVVENLKSHGILEFHFPGLESVVHGKSWTIMFIKKCKINLAFCEENGKNIPKMKDGFQENGQI